MAGYAALKVLREFELDVYTLGLEIAEYKPDTNLIKIVPRDDELPVYSRDASIFVGTIEEAMCWARGVNWARQYDEMIKISSDKTREKSEQKERNRQLMHAIETGRKPDGRVSVTKFNSLEEDEDMPF
jgi:hypothetical protein